MAKVVKIRLTDSEIWIQTKDGKTASEMFVDYPRLKYATQEQRNNYTTDDFGIHWEELNEDLSFEGFFQKKSATNPTSSSRTLSRETSSGWPTGL